MLIELPKNTIAALFDRAFQHHQNFPALGAVDGETLTFAQVQEKSRRLSSLLLARGIKPGDRVAIISDNCPEWVIAYISLTTVGIVAVPILTGFPDMDTRHIIRNAECIAAFVTNKYVSKLEGLQQSTLQAIFDLENSDSSRFEEDYLDAKQRLPKASTRIDSFPQPEPADLAAIIYTSGTTGHSKGVMLTHNNIVTDVVNSLEKFPLDHHDRFLSILPLSHTFEATGGMLCPLSAGSSIYYLKGLPTPQKLMTAMESVKPTAVLSVPLVIDKIYRKKVLPQLQGKAVVNRAYRISFFRKFLHQTAGKKLLKSFGGQLRFFMFGGAALNEDVENFLCEAKISYSTGYGMTETSPIMTINPFGKVKIGSCGQPIPGIEMKIYQPDPVTGIGEIIIRGPITMAGYYKNPQASQAAFLPDGWLMTGDLGYFDEEGYLFIKGRSKNVIIGPSGENIYPELIEQEILKSSYIQEVVVYKAQGKMVAKVYLDYDFIDQQHHYNNLTEEEATDLVQSILEQERLNVNRSLPNFSAINKWIEYPEPFEKTPTNKVKRYLYIPAE
ncbi:MAG TPA: AMP-binding protein [bacterium]|nr:AMP-binding protein [bacterium]HPG44444.1 AMP-binding protein [bacterium]HPM97002.1 AMP-binding protein [bacterium]